MVVSAGRPTANRSDPLGSLAIVERAHGFLDVADVKLDPEGRRWHLVISYDERHAPVFRFARELQRESRSIE